jgi:hypothetical protein
MDTLWIKRDKVTYMLVNVSFEGVGGQAGLLMCVTILHLITMGLVMHRLLSASACLALNNWCDTGICVQVGMSRFVRDRARIIAPKMSGHYDNISNANAKVARAGMSTWMIFGRALSSSRCSCLRGRHRIRTRRVSVS